jgi:hypothetical protein
MERRPDNQDPPAWEDTPRGTDDAAVEADPVQGWEEDNPTDTELEHDDGYHPEQGGSKYVEADPVDEKLLAEEEGLDEDETAQILMEEEAEEESR